MVVGGGGFSIGEMEGGGGGGLQEEGFRQDSSTPLLQGVAWGDPEVL